MKIKLDGDSAGRSVSKYRLGTTGNYKIVRRKVIEYLSKDENLDDSFKKWKILSEDFKKKHLEKMKLLGTKFGALELQAVAHLYDLPIIEISDKHRMAFFDRHYEAKTEVGMKKYPLYLYNKDGYYRYLKKISPSRYQAPPMVKV